LTQLTQIDLEKPGLTELTWIDLEEPRLTLLTWIDLEEPGLTQLTRIDLEEPGLTSLLLLQVCVVWISISTPSVGMTGVVSCRLWSATMLGQISGRQLRR